MWTPPPILRHFYAMLISLACISTLIVIKERTSSEVPPDFVFNETEEVDFFNNDILDFESDFFVRSSTLDIGWKFNKTIGNRSEETSSKELYLLGLFELSTKEGKRLEGRSEILAAKIAVRHVNDYDVLPGYNLKLLVNDTECDPGVGVDRFFHAVYSQRPIIMLLGSSCSNVTESLAKVTPYWNILQVSFGSTSPSLSDRKKFPLFFRTIAPDASHNTARVSFIRHFGWKTVAMLSQSENAFLLPLNDLVRHLESFNVTITAPVTFSLDNYREQLRALKESDTRIVIGSFSKEVAGRIFCEAYLLKLLAPEYVWLLQEENYPRRSNSSECSVGILEKATEGIILIADYSSISPNETSISGLTNDIFKEELKSEESISRFARHTYDAVWAMALTLRDATLNKGLNLQDFHYRRQDMVKYFLTSMSNLNFMGVSGPVRFSGADRVGNTLFKQIQGKQTLRPNRNLPIYIIPKSTDGRSKRIAIYDSETERLDFDCSSCSPVSWGARIPIAKRILEYRLITVPKTAFVAVVAVSVFGIAVSVVFLYFNVHFRKKKVVKLSSPRLNNVAVWGCVVVYLSVILHGLDHSTVESEEAFSRLCTIRVYLLSAGFSLAFGSMFAKTYRVNKIFTHGLVRNKSLQDKQLIISIFVLLLIDIIIISLWMFTDPLKRQLYDLIIEENGEDRGVVYQPQVEVCRSNNTVGWFVAIYGYKGCLLIIGVYMAWEARHVKVQALNDSQYIGICVYSAFFSAVIVMISNFLSEYPTFMYLATTGSILASTTLTLFLMFLPKLKDVFGSVESEDEIMKSMGLKCEYNTRRLLVQDDGEMRCRVEIQNRVYKSEIEALDREIARLEELIRDAKDKKRQDVYTISKSEIKAVPAIFIRRATCQNVLKEKTIQEEAGVFDRIKKIFGSIPSVLKTSIDDGKPLSDPEVHRYSSLQNDWKTHNVRCNSLSVVPKECWK